MRVVTEKERLSRKSLAEVLDRRRDIIDAAIVRMLKREKEKSLDSIAATVRPSVGVVGREGERGRRGRGEGADISMA